MKVVIQRVLRASVHSEGELLGSIDRGLMVLVGVLRGDGPVQVRKLAEKVARVRCFENEEGRMHYCAIDQGLPLLVVSQFTLAADGRKGRRPSFDQAAPPEEARGLYEAFVEELRGLGLHVETGRFQASMQVELVNDGPVTLVYEEPPEA